MVKYNIIEFKTISLSFWVKLCMNILYYSITRKLPNVLISLTNNNNINESLFLGKLTVIFRLHVFSVEVCMYLTLSVLLAGGMQTVSY